MSNKTVKEIIDENIEAIDELLFNLEDKINKNKINIINNKIKNNIELTKKELYLKSLLIDDD